MFVGEFGEEEDPDAGATSVQEDARQLALAGLAAVLDSAHCRPVEDYDVDLTSDALSRQST